MKEIYFSIDVETDGPIPGENSMLSLGCVAFDGNGKELGFFSKNLDFLPGAMPDEKTAAWWATQPDAWEEARKDTISPCQAMKEFSDFINSFGGIPVCVAYPATFDFMFVYWYLIKFTKQSPFSFSCLDVKTMIYSKLNLPFKKCNKKNIPKSWLPKVKHTHKALDDAREQGQLFFNMVQK